MKTLSIIIILCSYHVLCSMDKKITIQASDPLLQNINVSVEMQQANSPLPSEPMSRRTQNTCCGNTPQERCTNRFLLVNTMVAIPLTIYLVSLMMHTSGSCNQQ